MSKDVSVKIFGADWCGSCHNMHYTFAQIENDYHGHVKFTVIDVDEFPEKAKEHGVRAIPAFLIFKKGKLVSWIAGENEYERYTSRLDYILSD